MSALARYYLSEGWQVSGSDISPSDILKELKKDGVRVSMGQRPENLKNRPNLAIYNQAIPKNNPELMAARRLGIPCRTYPEIVGELTKKYKTIAVAGAHGKSTTTAMVAFVLIEAGLDPTVIVGTKLKEFGGKNFRKGKNGLLVLEADEYGGAFWHYSPFVAGITNIDKEHLDFYKNFENVKKSFERFKSQCQKVVEAEKNPAIAAKIRKILKIPGEHNIQNALLAYAIAKSLNISENVILRALGKYTGAWRRMEYKGQFQVSGIKCQVFDDYAHHPTEIRATLAGFRQKYPKNAIICVFQPHQAERLRLLFNDFKTAFKDADRVVLIPSYKVAGREEKFDKKYDAEALAKAIGAYYLSNPKSLPALLKKILYSKFNIQNSIVVMMGAGNIVDLTPMLVNKNRR